MNKKKRNRGPGLGEPNRQKIIDYLIDARREGHEGKQSKDVAKEIGSGVECARDHLNYLRDRYKWNGKTGGVVYNEEKNRKILWYIADEYYSWTLSQKELLWRRKAIVSGGYTQQVILEHYYHVCAGIVTIFKERGFDVTAELPYDYKQKMGLLHVNCSCFIPMAEQHLQSYRELKETMKEIEDSRRHYDDEQRYLIDELRARCRDELPLEFFPYDNPFFSSNPRDKLHDMFCRKTARTIVYNARLLNKDEPDIFSDGYLHSSGQALPYRMDDHEWDFCREGCEMEVQRFVEVESERVRPMVSKLDLLKTQIEMDKKQFQEHLIKFVTRVIEGKDLEGSCMGCPSPDSIIM